MRTKTVVLVILDGWGIGEHHQGNPIRQTQLPTFEWMKQNFPLLALQASGIAVGLPWGEEGNSEVGHLTIGAGKVIFQHYPRITMAIKDGSFFNNPALKGAFEHARQTGGKVHLLGLLTSGNVHASFEHLIALLRLAKDENATQLLLHLFTDGRDSGPREAPKLLNNLLKEISAIGIPARLASISGRFYAMDRDQRWDRTERVWKLLTTGTRFQASTDEVLEETYKRNLSDEFVEPTMIGSPEEAPRLTIKSGDALIFFDFREDAILQLAESFASSDFQGFEREPLENLYVATMTEYRPGLTPHVAFPPQLITNPLAKVLSDAGKRQLHLAESEKAAHVTYFFNGLRSEPFPQEFWVIIPSPQAFKFEEQPELAAPEITNRLLQALEEGIYDFIVVNFANPDLIAHTGNFNAAIEVAKIIDKHLNRIAATCLKFGFPLVITSDHGNIESMLDPMTGIIETRHNPSPVPFHLIDKRFYRPRRESEIISNEKTINGSLADVAPTILNLFNIPKPPEMTGESLLPLCR
jgi:2,3-bisphosphoglycerate-independent phosphoglycerate mutase